ncbi:MAG: aminoacyl-tRNA hydrolase [Pseudomonadota bacterium]
MAECKLIVGLGNPTSQYERTRHNAGFWFLDKLAEAYALAWSASGSFQGCVTKFVRGASSVYLLKPMTYMNHSGRSVGAVCRYYKINPHEVLVAHDELDFDVGTVKLKRGGGHGGHNGLKDIVAHLGSKDFLRLRIGIGHPGDRAKVVQYVLAEPSKTDRQAIDRAIEGGLEVIPELIVGRYGQAVNQLHAARCPP